MNFDVYYPHRKQDGSLVPGIKPVVRSISEICAIMQSSDQAKLIEEIRAGNKEKKKELPAVVWVGKSKSTRKISDMEPTQLVMLDIDHMEGDMLEHGKELTDRMRKTGMYDRVFIMHVTPSGKGVRIVFFAWEDLHTLEENMERARELLKLDDFGDFDEAVKDVSRLSFLPSWGDIWLIRGEMELSDMHYKELPITNNWVVEEEKPAKHSDLEFTEEEMERYDNMEYRGTPLKIIIEKYVEKHGEPSSGEIHNFYNDMVKNFRCICDNNKKALLYLLPRFGHGIEECWSQIKSICKVNTLSTLPKPFYFFLKDNGFYRQEERETSLKKYMMAEQGEIESECPYFPPIIREMVRICPKDFVFPMVNALMPVLGTLTSYVQALYPYDQRMHTTSFFSVIYAPPGSGKGFVERFLDMFFEDLKIRDAVQQARENIYLRQLNRKGANDKSPELPNTSLRIIPTKNSESEFLQKQADNHGYHMFTYAAEMDSWAKGVKAAGGNKDDMIRIAWDNGEYGQAFKSANTFKGVVKLHWNVLITGTIQQVESYFKDVENGLVTRCGFTPIENQEFAEAPVWRRLSKRDINNIRKFTLRCDRETYEEPCLIVPSELASISDDEFDKEVDWRFKFRPRQTKDCSWIMPTIDAFHKEQVRLAALDLDRARDVFRRRVAVRGFRLALLCMCLWEKPKEKDLQKCCSFIDWYMHEDIKRMLALWGEKYNNITDTKPTLTQRTVYSELGDTFTRNDIYAICAKQGIKTPIRRIVHDWKKLGYIEIVDKEHIRKVKGGRDGKK